MVTGRHDDARGCHDCKHMEAAVDDGDDGYTER